MHDLPFKCTKQYYSYKLINDGVSVYSLQVTEFIFFTGNWQLNVFLSQTIVFNYVKLVKKSMDKKVSNYTYFLNTLKILILAVQIKSCDNSFDPSYSFHHKFGRQLFWNGGKHSCFTPKLRTYEEIEVDISIFLGYSVLCKALVWFCSILIFSLQFFFYSLF